MPVVTQPVLTANEGPKKPTLSARIFLARRNLIPFLFVCAFPSSVRLCEDVAAGLLGADAFYQSGLNERPQEIESALFGDGKGIPNFARGETFVVAEQMEQLLLSGAQDEFLLFRFCGELLHASPDPLQRQQESFGAVFEPVGQIFALLTYPLQGGVVAGAVLPVEF